MKRLPRQASRRTDLAPRAAGSDDDVKWILACLTLGMPAVLLATGCTADSPALRSGSERTSTRAAEFANLVAAQRGKAMAVSRRHRAYMPPRLLRRASPRTTALNSGDSGDGGRRLDVCIVTCRMLQLPADRAAHGGIEAARPVHRPHSVSMPGRHVEGPNRHARNSAGESVAGCTPNSCQDVRTPSTTRPGAWQRACAIAGPRQHTPSQGYGAGCGLAAASSRHSGRS